MVPARNGSDATGFCVSIEAATGVTTGISAADRARTIQVAVDPATGPPTSSGPAMSSRFGPARAACSSAAGRPRRPST